ncbi:MAG: Spy/CpxP family protein refolding chaperone [Nitrosomonas sp.]|nr:Spy/CpxP family protein refolding chaperone [Nitrosomonas sp.]
MARNKLIFLVSSTLIFLIGIASIAVASNNPIESQIENKNILLAQAQQHSHEKEALHEKHDRHKKWDKHGKEPDYAHMIISHTDALKLSDEQLGKIVRLHLKYDQEHKQIKHQLMKSVKNLKRESMIPSTTDDQLRKLGKELAESANAMIEHHINERSAIHGVLTGEQRKQLNSLKMDHDSDKHGHSHH